MNLSARTISRKRPLAVLLLLIMLAPGHRDASGQPSSSWDVDTLTSGASQERNPSMQHNVYDGPGSQWVVYEREDAGLVSIWGLRVDMQSRTWGTEFTRISDYAPPGMISSPDVAGTGINSASAITLRIVAWEQRTSDTWDIWYSTRSDSDASWSAPQQLTADSVDNTGVQLRPVRDHVLATWRRGKELWCARIGARGIVDTVLVGQSSTDSLEFDVWCLGNLTGFIWTSKDSLGDNRLVYRYFEFRAYGEPNWSVTASVLLPFPIRRPWFVRSQGWFPSGLPIVEFEADRNGRSRVFYFIAPDYLEELSTDTSADFVNPQGLFIPVIGKRSLPGKPLATNAAYGIDFIERRGESDTSFIFDPSEYGLFSDTLRGPGQNTGMIVGSPASAPLSISPWYPIVWQSNRSGQWHLYGTFLVRQMGDVGSELGLPDRWELSQNYPNPFNPSTTIRYGLPVRSFVSLTVYDMLGQQVAVLQNGEQQAGYHETVFDASGVASGVYLYRLTAGNFVETRKLVLVR